MKTKEILKGDELIAKFMEYKPCNDPNHKDDLCYYIGTISDQKIGYRKSHEMKFSTSWDWLMPVVLKIYSLEYPVHIYRDKVIISEKYNPVIKTEGNMSNDTLNTLYSAVVEFIKYYNDLH